MDKVTFCGAFNGEVARRAGETDEQVAERVQETMQRVLDSYAKRLNVVVGVDFGDIGYDDAKGGK